MKPNGRRPQPSTGARAVLAWCVVAGALGLPFGLTAACSDGPGPGGAKTGPVEVVESVDHEACDPNGGGHRAEAFSTRADGKPVVIKVYAGATEVCRISDINHDGKPDLYEYFDSQGNLRRRESDYDSNGIVDSVEIFEGGKLVKREYDTTGQHRVDTWDYFDKTTGKRTRRERDTTNDGKVDQWWTWDGDKITIAIDRNGDGQPDPGATLVLDEKTGATQMLEAKSPSPSGSAAPTSGPPGATSVSSSPAVPEGPPPPVSPTASAQVSAAPSAPPRPASGAPSSSASAKPASSGASK